MEYSPVPYLNVSDTCPYLCALVHAPSCKRAINKLIFITVCIKLTQTVLFRLPNWNQKSPIYVAIKCRYVRLLLRLLALFSAPRSCKVKARAQETYSTRTHFHTHFNFPDLSHHCVLNQLNQPNTALTQACDE